MDLTSRTSLTSTGSTSNPFASKCSIHLLQQPQEGLLSTAMVGSPATAAAENSGRTNSMAAIMYRSLGIGPVSFSGGVAPGPGDGVNRSAAQLWERAHQSPRGVEDRPGGRLQQAASGAAALARPVRSRFWNQAARTRAQRPRAGGKPAAVKMSSSAP